MTDYDVTTDELKTLALFATPGTSPEVDPEHFAKLLSLALVVQREGGPELTASGHELLSTADPAALSHVQGGGRL